VRWGGRQAEGRGGLSRWGRGVWKGQSVWEGGQGGVGVRGRECVGRVRKKKAE